MNSQPRTELAATIVQSTAHNLGSERLDPRMWRLPLGQFVQSVGAGKLAEELRYHRSAIYHWVSGSVAPHTRVARRVVELADERGFMVEGDGARRRKLSLNDVIFGQRDFLEKVRVR